MGSSVGHMRVSLRGPHKMLVFLLVSLEPHKKGVPSKQDEPPICLTNQHLIQVSGKPKGDTWFPPLPSLVAAGLCSVS